MQKGVPVKFFLFADNGYPPYGTTMVTTTKFVAERPDVGAPLREGLDRGLEELSQGRSRRRPTALIKADNPKMSDEQIAFGIKRLNELEVLDGGDARTMGIGIITEARWKATYELMVQRRPAAEGRPTGRKGFTTAVREGPQDHRPLT